MSQMIFQILDGLPVPLLPVAPDGSPRKPDGELWFTPEQASARLHVPVERLNDQAAMIYGEIRNASIANAHAALEPIDPIRQMRFSHLNEEQYAYVVAFCQQRGLSPSQVWAEVRSEGRKQIVLVNMKIEGLRELAHRTGKYAGCDPTEFVYGDDPRIPAKAIGTVYRMIDGQRQPFRYEVYWDDYRPDSVEGTFWEKAHLMLGKCARAAALRDAFPELCSEIYVEEELLGRRPKPKQDGTATSSPPSSGGMPSSPEDRPQTQMGFHTRLMDFGFKTPSARAALITRMQQAIGHLLVQGDDETVFYAEVVARLRREPGRWGATPPAAAEEAG